MVDVKSEVKLSKLLKEKYINLELKQNTKRQLLVELVDFAASAAGLKDKRTLSNAILKRERLGSTGIGGGVAIPHAKSDKIGSFILVFARHNQGLDFGSLDGEKTYIFFMLASPQAEVGTHLKALSEIARLVKDKFIVEKLKKAKTKKDILNIVSIYEK